jgi:double-stranded uracil-DNA glycosylase
VGFTKDQLEQFRDATVPDLLGPECKLLFVGINPGLWTAATQTHFCHPSNRFYPALRKAGLINFEIDSDRGFTDSQRQRFIESGMGISNLVQRATVRASELGQEELVSGGKRLSLLIEDVQPAVVAVAGVTAYRTAFGEKTARLGRQQREGSTDWWVVPNPSGLNAHTNIDDLASWFRQVATAAGIL